MEFAEVLKAEKGLILFFARKAARRYPRLLGYVDDLCQEASIALWQLSTKFGYGHPEYRRRRAKVVRWTIWHKGREFNNVVRDPGHRGPGGRAYHEFEEYGPAEVGASYSPVPLGPRLLEDFIKSEAARIPKHHSAGDVEAAVLAYHRNQNGASLCDLAAEAGVTSEAMGKRVRRVAKYLTAGVA